MFGKLINISRLGWLFSSKSQHKIIMLVAMFSLLSIMLVSLTIVQSQVLDGVRAFVRGEGLWAKAQKDAFLNLYNYIYTGNEADYKKFVANLKVPLGDKTARLALMNHPDDIADARQGFLAGKNHPMDVDNMIHFFLRFQNFPYVSDAIVIWAQGDALIIQLEQLGASLQTAIKENDQQKIKALSSHLSKLNANLADLENRFSLTLSEGARWVKKILVWLDITVVTIMLILAWLVARRVIKDITDTEDALRTSQHHYQSLFESNMVGIIDWHVNGQILNANDTFLNLLGYNREDLKNNLLNWRSLTPNSGYERDRQALSEIMQSRSCIPFEKEFYHRDGTVVPVYIGAVLFEGEDETGICLVIDQTERKADEAQRHLAATVFDSSSDGIVITNPDMRVVRVNKAFCSMTGFEVDELRSYIPKALNFGVMPKELRADIQIALQQNGYWQGDTHEQTRDGNFVPVRLSINSVKNEESEIEHYVCIFNDISERKVAEQQLRKLAQSDFLTGLANRSIFSERLDQALIRAKRRKSKLALLFCDLDHFKPVNDIYGHDVGDRLLCEIAHQLRELIREEDTLARIGGDEFVIIMDNLPTPESAAILANKVIETISRITEIDGHQIDISSSVGISLYPEHGSTLIELTRSADIAMYKAKDSGRNRYCYFSVGIKEENHI